jgi:hypothetical protein
MRIVTALALVLLLVAPAAAAPRSGASSPKAVFLTQAQLFRQGKFRAMYERTYTRSYRAHCSWKSFFRGETALKHYLGPGFKVRGVRARMLGTRRALMAYTFVRANGQVVGAVTFKDGDAYAKQGKRWYDEYDRGRC